MLALALGVSACQTTDYEGKGHFLTNDTRQSVAPQQLSEISKSWKNDARAAFRTSQTDAGTVAWIADFIAVTEAQGTQGIGRCSALTALELKRLPLTRFTIYDDVKKVYRHYLPERYNEAWFVDSCGKRREWRVFYDPADRNPLTVLLWDAGK